MIPHVLWSTKHWMRCVGHLPGVSNIHSVPSSMLWFVFQKGWPLQVPFRRYPLLNQLCWVQQMKLVGDWRLRGGVKVKAFLIHPLPQATVPLWLQPSLDLLRIQLLLTCSSGPTFSSGYLPMLIPGLLILCLIFRQMYVVELMNTFM